MALDLCTGEGLYVPPIEQCEEEEETAVMPSSVYVAEEKDVAPRITNLGAETCPGDGLYIPAGECEGGDCCDELREKIAKLDKKKQDVLKAGNGIEISEDNTITSIPYEPISNSYIDWLVEQ